MKNFTEKICNKLKIKSIGVDYYEVEHIKWAHVGAILEYGTNQTYITAIDGNRLYVNAIIPTPTNIIYLQKITKIYENQRLNDLLIALSADGYLPFMLDNILSSDGSFNDTAQLTVAIPYPEYSLHTQALNAARYYANAIIDCYRKYSVINLLNINSITNYHNLSSGLEGEVAAKFKYFYAGVSIDYSKTYAPLSN